MSGGAFIDEVFSSIQGEGLLLGEVQLFIRFSLCNLKCLYCDSPRALKKQRHARVEAKPFSQKFRKVPNPISKEELIRIVKRFDKDNAHYHSISLTGGEPLCQADFLKRFLRDAKKLGKIFYLETNGTLPLELKKIVRSVDIISMDIKLPSSSGQKIDFNEVEKFLELAARKEVFVKIVITSQTTISQLTRTCEIIAGVEKSIPLILQPVSKTRKFKKVPDPEKLYLAVRSCRAILSDVRVIPQMHKALGMR